MPTGRKTILIVDDEPNIVLGLRDALEFEELRNTKRMTFDRKRLDKV